MVTKWELRTASHWNVRPSNTAPTPTHTSQGPGVKAFSILLDQDPEVQAPGVLPLLESGTLDSLRPKTWSPTPISRETRESFSPRRPRPLRDWVCWGATRGLPGLSGPRRRLRGGAARLAQRRGRGPGGPQPASRNPRVSRNERSHCPTQTVKKLLEEQRRRQQQQPDAGGVQGQFPPPLAQPLTPSVNEAEAGHPHFPAHQETVGSGLGSLAPPMGFPDWDPNTHAAYTDSPFSYPASAAESFLTPDFYPPSDPGRPCPFPQGMEAGSWRVSALPAGPPQLSPVATGPSLDAARAHMASLGPQQLLAQDEEGDTLLHLFAARGLRWAAYAAAEVFQVYRHLDVREHKGKTPLLVAAAANQPLIVEDLLNLGAEPNATDYQGRSVLHVAATYGLPGVLSVCPAGRWGVWGGLGAQILASRARRPWETLTQHSAFSSSQAVFNSGVQVDLEARDFEGLTPLHTAILALNIAMRPPDLCPRVLSTQARDRLTCVQMLLHMGADHTSQ
ncbi:NF-kappa-B inhibitor zeta-like, partial [Carlito syrichta]|uniref:NF-kappa-B inhibitor zeta-like n=1 Tax=Carlito syrichta TaxID=1868482 RepID=A0A3Q0DJ85_CARSF